MHLIGYKLAETYLILLLLTYHWQPVSSYCYLVRIVVNVIKKNIN